MFEDVIALSGKIKDEVKTKLESWRNALERRGMKVNRSKTV